MQPQREGDVFTFGEFRVDPIRQELFKHDRSIKLQPLHFKLLLALVENHDRLVTREELRQKLWGPDTFVDFETGLNHCIRVLRATLSDDAQAPRYIETVPKRGYRFIAAVEGPSTTTPEPVPVVEAVAPPATRRNPGTYWRLILALSLV